MAGLCGTLRAVMRFPFLQFVLGALFACLLVACAGERRPLEATNAKRVDYSGNWELNYAKSDNIQARLNTLVRDLQRQAEQRAQRGGNQGAVSIGGGSNSGASIIGLAQMADMITQTQLLEIAQTANTVKIKREGNFTLSCEFFGGDSPTVESPLGTEICGWDSHQLVYRLYLPEGLSIQHRFSLGPDGERLNVATTVVSDQVSSPFVLNRVYNRFVPGQSGFRCEQTLTRGKVCTTESR